MYGSTGMGDVVPLAHLTFDLMIAEVYLAPSYYSSTNLIFYYTILLIISPT